MIDSICEIDTVLSLSLSCFLIFVPYFNELGFPFFNVSNARHLCGLAQTQKGEESFASTTKWRKEKKRKLS
jgi:hypothetical protein